MKFGVTDNRVVVTSSDALSYVQSTTMLRQSASPMLRSKDERLNMASELIGAAIVLIRNDFSTREEMIDYILSEMD